MQKMQYTFLDLRRFLFYKTEIWKDLDGITFVLVYPMKEIILPVSYLICLFLSAAIRSYLLRKEN